MMAKRPCSPRSAEFRVERSESPLSSAGYGYQVRRPRPCISQPPLVDPASGRPADAARGGDPAKRRGERSVLVEAVDALDRRGADHRSEAELDRLGNPALRMGDMAQLAGQPHLTEAGKRPPASTRERLAPVSRD